MVFKHMWIESHARLLALLIKYIQRGCIHKQMHSLLIVEGPTDKKLYGQFIDTSRCQIIIAYSKATAIEALSTLEKDNCLGILAIVDADFDVLEDTLSTSHNLLLTDTHDLETMMLQSPALEKLLTEYCSEGKMATFEEKHGKDVRAKLVESATPVGYLRWASQGKAISHV